MVDVSAKAVTARSATAEAIVHVNEAVAALHEGVVADAELLDAGVIFGTGFAPFRGGPIQYIRDSGAEVLLARLKVLQAKYGDRFAPRRGWDNPALLKQ